VARVVQQKQQRIREDIRHFDLGLAHQLVLNRDPLDLIKADLTRRRSYNCVERVDSVKWSSGRELRRDDMPIESVVKVVNGPKCAEAKLTCNSQGSCVCWIDIGHDFRDLQGA
jgi:hypothetical protein